MQEESESDFSADCSAIATPVFIYSKRNTISSSNRKVIKGKQYKLRCLPRDKGDLLKTPLFELGEKYSPVEYRFEVRSPFEGIPFFVF